MACQSTPEQSVIMFSFILFHVPNVTHDPPPDLNFDLIGRQSQMAGFSSSGNTSGISLVAVMQVANMK
jgi:hypothetical protein